MPRPLNDRFLYGRIDDVSTADQVYIVSPVSGTIVKIYSVINGAITVADADLTAKIAGTAVTGGVITIAATGSAAGIVDEASPTAANVVEAGQAIEIETDGASTDAAEAIVTVVVRETHGDVNG